MMHDGAVAACETSHTETAERAAGKVEDRYDSGRDRAGHPRRGLEDRRRLPRISVIGSDGDRSILAHREAWGTDHPTFELWDEREDVSYWVREIPTPRQAEELLQEHGAPPKEELSILYQ
jgi:hypothetical protein